MGWYSQPMIYEAIFRRGLEQLETLARSIYKV